MRDESGVCYRPTSDAFRNFNLSVDIEAILAEHGHDWRFTLIGHEGFSLVRFTAGNARGLGQAIMKKPVQGNPGNPAHGEVIGNKERVKRRFTQLANWVHCAPPA